MHTKKQNWKQTLLSLIVLAIFGYFTWHIISFFIHSLVKTDPKISAAIIGGMFTVFAGLAAVIITQKQTKLREIEEAHREKKIEIYNKFIAAATSMVAGKNENLDVKAPSEKELLNIMFNFKKDILLWGSPKVIKAQFKLEKLSQENSQLILVVVNDMYKAMREDIGLSNSGLNNNELIKLFLLDPEKLDEAIADNK